MQDNAANPALQQAFGTWLAGVTAAGAAARLSLGQDPLPPLLAQASRAQFVALGLHYDAATPDFGRKFVGTGDLRVEHAPGGAHTALSLILYEGEHGFWWVDGRPLPMPPDAPAGLMFDCIARWMDDHTLAIPVGGLAHPLADPRVNDALGELRGLLLHDAAQIRSTLALPAEHERWVDPVAIRVDERIAIHAAQGETGAAPVRWLDTF